MRNNTNQGTEYPAAIQHYLEALMDKRDFAGAVKYYDDNRDAIASADGSQAATSAHLTARAFASLSDYPNALKTARIAQNLMSGSGDTLVLAELFLTIGGIQRDSGMMKEAEKAFRDAESIFRRNDSIEGQSRALNALAGLFFRVQDYKNSLATLMEAITIAKRLGDKKKLAFMMGNIGRIHTFNGSFSEAVKHLQINIDLSTELGDWLEVGRASLSLAYVHIQSGDYDNAEQLLDSAYRHILARDSKRDEVIYLTYLGELEYRRGQLDRGREILQSGLALANRIASGSSLAARVMRHLAEVHMRMGSCRLSSRMTASALNIFERSGDKVETGALYKIKGMIAEAGGKCDHAKECYIKALDLLAESSVRFEKADALVAAGQSPLFSERQRITYLLRADEFYTRNQLTLRAQKVQKLINAIDYPPSNPSRKQKNKSSVKTGYLTACEKIKSFLAQLEIIGRSELPLFLSGETGVGKDHMVRYYHQVSRPDGPFISINCASVPETLLESELFGYKRGSFTGAVSSRIGLFPAANGGVLFLDEIGDMPLSLQAKLLGVLESRTVTPLGSTTPVKFDVKLVVATNRNLEEMVEAGTFRRDLFYRISGISFEIPPLRERQEDIVLLTNHFLRAANLLNETETAPTELISRFVNYQWPGNVRELNHIVKKMEVMAEMAAEGDLVNLAGTILSNDLPETDCSLFDKVENFERKLITEALLAAGGNKSEAARMLGIHEATVRTKLKRYGISLEESFPH
jgi:DNA-binding NtrC family response regulator/tetratricopeptide (TPR) repeat protein